MRTPLTSECRPKSLQPHPWSAAVWTVLAVWVATTASASAATGYEFTISSEGAYSSTQAGKILVDGGRWRVDLDGASADVRAFDSVVQSSHGRRIALNHANKTWFHLSSAVVYVPSLFDFHRSHPTNVLDLKLGPFRTTMPLHEAAEFHYKTRAQVGSEMLRGKVQGRVARVVGPDVVQQSPMSVLFSLSSGIPRVDEALRRAALDSPDPIWQIELTVKRQFDGSAVMTQTIRWSVTPGRPVHTDPFTFEVPAGYSEQPPQTGIPGHG
jgi:hypothetical protein